MDLSNVPGVLAALKNALGPGNGAPGVPGAPGGAPVSADASEAVVAPVSTPLAPPPTPPDAANPVQPNGLPDILGRVAGATPEPEPPETLDDKVTRLSAPPPASAPALAPPPPPPKPSLLERVASSPWLRVLGAAGAGMAAAGDREDKGRAGQQLQSAFQAQNAARMKERELEEVEKPKAQATVDYLSGRNETAQNVAQTRAQASQNVANTNVQGRENVARINASSKEQIAALQAGAPMTITPEMAKIAGQPQIAGQQLSGKSLANFMRVFTATGAGIHDLGDEGLWAVDRMGNRIQRVAVSSPSVARAREFAAARAANTPVNVLEWDENGRPSLKAISQAQQLRTGVPSATTENSILGPTAATRTMGQMASTVTPHLNVLRQQVLDLAPDIGPLMGRFVVQGLAGKLGSTGDPVLDQKLGAFIANLKLASSAVGRTHFAGRTGLPASQYFEQLFNAAKSPEQILGVLDSVPQYIEGYAANSAIAPQPRTGAGAQFGTVEQMKPGGGAGGGALKTLDLNTAKAILQEAGGDKVKARALAKQRGFKF